ncbi:MAG: excinuclease ABC subunit UvrA, partial [Flavobacteriales bacterium]
MKKSSDITEPLEKENALESIEVLGARVHNLKNVDVSFSRNKLVVFTGLSGSGKSSLAFDTIYAEGQRRYIETLSSYARTFLGSMERPDVDKINGLSPVISIEQKTISRNPRSTVGTVTEIYDFLRLLFARAGTAYSYVTGKPMVKYNREQILHLIKTEYNNKKILILAPVVKGRKGLYKDLIEQIRKLGFLRVRVDGKVHEIIDRISLDRYKIHDIEIVIDRLEVNEASENRVTAAIQLAHKHGKDSLMVMDPVSKEVRSFSLKLMCAESGISYAEPAPNLFSFNSPYGACPFCSGLGRVLEADLNKIIPNPNKSIAAGAIVPLGEAGKSSHVLKVIDGLLRHHKLKLSTPVKEIPEDVIGKILYGCEEKIKLESGGGVVEYENGFEGLVNFILRQAQENPSAPIQRWAHGFMLYKTCSHCSGSRLKKESMYFKIDKKNIFELASMDIRSLHLWSKTVLEMLDIRQQTIAKPVIKEIAGRLGFLLDVGLEYLTLDRSSRTLSGGEAQRIRLATQIGSELTGVLYILDEPSIGLHQRDNRRLIGSLKNLRDIGNSVIVVEHDKEMIEEADVVVDIGPGAGVHGGEIMQIGTPNELLDGNSLTAQYLSGKKRIKTPVNRRKGNGKFLELQGATGNNLKNVDLQIPLGVLTCVTGVSGSGKSTLINETLYPVVS